MININKFQKSILETVDILVKERLGKIGYNYYVEGIIKIVNGDGTYVVTINESDTTLKSKLGSSFQVGDVVYITVVNGNYSNKFIDCIKP